MSKPGPAAAPPVFVVGCGRSGTTLLRLMLDSHSQLAIPGESHFIPHMWRRRHRYRSEGALDVARLTQDLLRISHVARWALREEEVLAQLAGNRTPAYEDVVHALFLAYSARKGKTRWGDKTPVYARFVPLLSGLFPGSQFIHIIRDGRDVCSSYLSIPYGPRTVWQAAHRWNLWVQSARHAGARLGAQRYTEVRYEELVDQPERELRRLCAFAGLPFEDGMLLYYLDAKDRSVAHPSTSKPPTPGMRDWRHELPDKEVLAFEAVAGPLLIELGYERRFQRIPSVLKLKGRILVEFDKAYAFGARVNDTLNRRQRYGPIPSVNDGSNGPELVTTPGEEEESA